MILMIFFSNQIINISILKRTNEKPNWFQTSICKRKTTRHERTTRVASKFGQFYLDDGGAGDVLMICVRLPLEEGGLLMGDAAGLSTNPWLEGGLLGGAAEGFRVNPCWEGGLSRPFICCFCKNT